ncbi:hypothetical protein HD597_007067 [Nonomuraea thailandensis]|uniref:Uncharacterized protein n=1 Tax=Nonomuraea thailandensis TaxID=1188745 RepID=A0A9X2GKT4_9ACTN|nr:hypothetical protein [Nonomuraea thailandensis]MCP2360047.1 hypothetical protein [Nonomuraea thailandensis]
MYNGGTSETITAGGRPIAPFEVTDRVVTITKGRAGAVNDMGAYRRHPDRALTRSLRRLAQPTRRHHLGLALDTCPSPSGFVAGFAIAIPSFVVSDVVTEVTLRWTRRSAGTSSCPTATVMPELAAARPGRGRGEAASPT